MAERKWTLVLMPHGSGASRVVQLSHTALKVAAAVAGAVVLLALVLGYTTVSRSVDLRRASEMARENATLATSLSGLQGRLDLLEDTLSAIAERDRKIRLLANLDPHDPQVLQAGVGGSRPARASGSAVLRQASAARGEVNGLIRRANLLAASFTEAADSLASHRERLAATPSILPTSGWLSSAFASMRRHPILHVSRPHEGLDISAPKGTPIEAPGAGMVTEAGWESGYGQTLTVDHGYGIVTRYAHASKLLVRRGQRVKRGDRIALVGNSGLATGPHLHYEVRVNGRAVDPLRYVLPDVITE
jgi:murein DD-endopeptidase MepM/ murein hydrolase activator NlpD